MRTSGAEHWCAFGTRVKTSRQERGLMLRGFAREISVAPSYLSYIETGTVPPPSDAVILRMAEVLQIDASELLIEAGRLPADILSAFWQHPAIPPILGTLPGMTVSSATSYCLHMLSTLPHD